MITSIATRMQTVKPDMEAVRNGLNDLAADLTRGDEQLTRMESSGSRVGAGWASWFSEVATRALSLRDGAAGYLLAVGRDDLVSLLSVDALDLAESSGRMAFMHANGHILAPGWSTTLDNKISDVTEAAKALVAPPTPPTPPVPPTPPTPPAPTPVPPKPPTPPAPTPVPPKPPTPPAPTPVPPKPPTPPAPTPKPPAPTPPIFTIPPAQ